MKKRRWLCLGLFDAAKSDACKIHFFEIAEALAQRGAEVEAMVPNAEIDESALFGGVRVSVFGGNYTESLWRATWLSLLQLKEYALKSNSSVDVVYVRWRLLPAFFLRLINRFKGLKPVIVSEHNGWVELEVELQRGSPFMGRIARLLQLWDGRSADAVIAVTDGIRQRLAQGGVAHNKVFTVDNGTNTELFHPLPDKDAIKERLLGGRGPVMGFTGNLARWQGVEAILEAFDRVAETHPEARLLLVGSGLHEESVRRAAADRKCADRITLAGNVDYAEMNLWLNAMDIGLAPKSRALEGAGYSPLKVRDYAAAGIPVLASDVTGLREFEPLGWLRTFDPDVSGDLGRVLVEMLADTEELRQRGAKARAYAEEHFSWERAAAKIEGVVDSVLKGR